MSLTVLAKHLDQHVHPQNDTNKSYSAYKWRPDIQSHSEDDPICKAGHLTRKVIRRRLS